MRSLFLIAALLAAAGAARAEWRKLDGQKAPSVVAKEWINTGKETPGNSELRGKVWLLEFFATW